MLGNMAAWIVTIFALTVGLAQAASIDPASEPCTTPRCLAAAEELTALLDFTVNPCDDLDAFVCGKWRSKQLPLPPSVTQISFGQTLMVRIMF